MEEVLPVTSFAEHSLAEFSEALSSDAPTPGGGTASAVAGSMGAALVLMVARLTLGRDKYAEAHGRMEAVQEEVQVLREELLDLADDDAVAFEAVMRAYRLPKGDEKEKAARSGAIQAAVRQAVDVPLQVARRCLRVLVLAGETARCGNPNAASDSLVAGELSLAGLRGAVANVFINLPSLKDQEFRTRSKEEAEEALEKAESLVQAVRSWARDRM